MTIRIHGSMPEILASLTRLTTLTEHSRSMAAGAQILLEECMTDEAEVRTEITHLRDIILADTANDQAAVDALIAIRAHLEEQIADLQAQLANVPDVAAPDFDGILADLKSLETLIVPVNDHAAIDPTVPVGETPVDPDPHASEDETSV